MVAAVSGLSVAALLLHGQAAQPAAILRPMVTPTAPHTATAAATYPDTCANGGDQQSRGAYTNSSAPDRSRRGHGRGSTTRREHGAAFMARYWRLLLKTIHTAAFPATRSST